MIGLSKSSLDTFKDCPKCFWLEKIKKLKRPAGIKASIMNGIDDCMKQVSTYAVENGTVANYLGNLKGAAPYRDRDRLKTMMNWRTFQAEVSVGNRKALIWGQLDDLIEWEDGGVSPWDFKSNGKKRDWVPYTEQYNLLQADMYDILLGANGLKPNGDAYFTYSWPVVTDGLMGFWHETVKIQTDPERALLVIEAAVRCLEGDMPGSSAQCEYCAFAESRRGL